MENNARQNVIINSNNETEHQAPEMGGVESEGRPTPSKGWWPTHRQRPFRINPRLRFPLPVPGSQRHPMPRAHFDPRLRKWVGNLLPFTERAQRLPYRVAGRRRWRPKLWWVPSLRRSTSLLSCIEDTRQCQRYCFPLGSAALLMPVDFHKK